MDLLSDPEYLKSLEQQRISAEEGSRETEKEYGQVIDALKSKGLNITSRGDLGALIGNNVDAVGIILENISSNQSDGFIFEIVLYLSKAKGFDGTRLASLYDESRSKIVLSVIAQTMFKSKVKNISHWLLDACRKEDIGGERFFLCSLLFKTNPNEAKSAMMISIEDAPDLAARFFAAYGGAPDLAAISELVRSQQVAEKPFQKALISIEKRLSKSKRNSIG